MPKITFIKTDGTRVDIDAPSGLSVLEIAHRNNIDLEGACEGSLACSTCHVIVDPEWYEILPTAKEDEEDMLDLAFGLTAHLAPGLPDHRDGGAGRADRLAAGRHPQHDARQVAWQTRTAARRNDAGRRYRRTCRAGCWRRASAR